MKEKTCGDCNFILAMWGKLWCGVEGQVIKRKWEACKHFKQVRNFKKSVANREDYVNQEE